MSTYDFTRCKLCTAPTAVPTYRLRETTVYTCPCGFHFIDALDTIPSIGNGRKLDAAAERFIEGQLRANERQHRKNLALVKKFCTLPRSTCLDVGAGAGVFTRLAADEGASVHGIEPQRVFCEFAARKFNLDLKRETIDHPDWQQRFAGHFDLVFMWDVLEHVNFPSELLRDAFRVIKPGGWLFLDTPCRDSVFYRLSEWSYRRSNGATPLFLGSYYSPKPFRHKQIFSRRQLIQFVEHMGLNVIYQSSPFMNLRNKMMLVCRKSVPT